MGLFGNPITPNNPFGLRTNWTSNPPMPAASAPSQAAPPPDANIDPLTGRKHYETWVDPVTGENFQLVPQLDPYGQPTGWYPAPLGFSPRDSTSGAGISSPAAMLQAEKAAGPEERMALAKLAADTQTADTAAREQGGLYDTQASLGEKLLNNLITLQQNPAAGPLGLLAYGAYGGGAQNIAAGTGGAGIASPYSGLLDALLGHLSAPLTQDASLFNSIGGGRSGTEKIQPNKAPGMTPESAAGAPDARQSLIDAWNAYHPGQPYRDPNSTTSAPSTAAVMPGESLTPVPAMSAIPTPVLEPNASILPRRVTALPGAEKGGAIPLQDNVMATLQSPAAKILARARTIYKDNGGSEHDFDRIVTGAMQAHAQTQAQAQPSVAAPVAAPVQPPLMAGGGDMTIGGEPHFIVDSSGKKVAALTEDGKPESVSGVGGVEVTPMDPMRKAAYEQRKVSMKRMGSMLADLATPAAPVAAATGATALFPNSTVGQSQVTPTTFGGPDTTREQQVGNYFKSSVDPTTGRMTMPSEATDATVANDPAGYAKILGGALSAGNHAVPAEWLTALNAGRAPGKILSTTAYNTLLPSQQAGYLALLQQMGLGTPQDVMAQMKRFQPDTMR